MQYMGSYNNIHIHTGKKILKAKMVFVKKKKKFEAHKKTK